MPAEQEPVVGLPQPDGEIRRPENGTLRGAGTLADVMGVAAAEQYFKEKDALERFNLNLAWERFGQLAMRNPNSRYYRSLRTRRPLR